MSIDLSPKLPISDTLVQDWPVALKEFIPVNTATAQDIETEIAFAGLLQAGTW